MFNDKPQHTNATMPVIEKKHSFSNAELLILNRLIKTVIVKTQTILAIAALLFICSCNTNQEKSPPSFAPKVVKAKGYIVPRDSMVPPEIVPVRNVKSIPAGKPVVVTLNSNVHPA